MPRRGTPTSVSAVSRRSVRASARHGGVWKNFRKNNGQSRRTRKRDDALTIPVTPDFFPVSPIGDPVTVAKGAALSGPWRLIGAHKCPWHRPRRPVSPCSPIWACKWGPFGCIALSKYAEFFFQTAPDPSQITQRLFLIVADTLTWSSAPASPPTLPPLPMGSDGVGSGDGLEGECSRTTVLDMRCDAVHFGYFFLRFGHAI